MSLFQNSVLNKYLKGLESEKVNEAYERFTSHFHNPTIQENIRNSKEEQYQGEFLIDLFVNVLGYTKNPTPEFNLTTELKNIKGSKKTDGAILKGEKALAVIELKGTNTTDLSKVETQAFGYKNNQPGCNYVITSNFEKLRFYIDNAVDFEEFNLFQLSKERFDILWLCLSSEYLLKDIPKKIKDESLTQEENVTIKLYKDYASFRNEIFDAIQKENPEYDKLTLFKKTQKLLDRFLFIFFAEDRLLLPPNSIRSIVNQWTDLRDKYDEYFPLYDRFKKYFGYMNTGHKGQQHDIFAYNGGLFAPDEILDNIKINDDLLHKHTVNLSNYDFESEVSVNILGHIFEHSLNDIDEIQAEIQGVSTEQSKTKRKKDGVFYTPKYITKYIVDNTVGKLCEEKKTELDIQEAEYEKERKGRQKATLKKLSQKLEDYRKWLLQITICDPACGSGAFLNQALEFLIAEHQYIDELQAKLFGDAMVLSEVENAILENNIYGVDINEESVEIAKLSLWLRTAQKGRKLTSLNNNIKCGNSLIDDPKVAGDKAFNWQNEFPEVFSKGGFDVVIGNPPYVNVELMPGEDKEYYRSSYVTFFKRSDLFSLFLELATERLTSKGYVSYIIPSIILNNLSYKKTRENILTNKLLAEVCYTGNKVFKDATVDTTILILDKSKRHKQIGLVDALDFFQPKGLFVDLDYFSKYDNNISVASSSTNNITDKIFKDEFEVADNHFLIFQGVVTGNNDAYIFDNINEAREKGIDEDLLKPMCHGRDISKWVVNYERSLCYVNGTTSIDDFPSTKNWLLNFKNKLETRRECRKGVIPWYSLQWPREQEYFEKKPKILIQNTRNERLKPRIVATIDEKGLFGTQGLNFIVATSNYNIYTFLGLLNSKLIDYLFSTKFLNLAIKADYLKKLKFPKSLATNGIDNNAQNLSELNNSFSQLVNKFISLFQSKFKINKLTNKLKAWHDLDFGEFLKELEKARKKSAKENETEYNKLSLSEEAEWMQYFNEQKQKAEELKTEIDKTDKEIDQMVYELYGLTEEEINIVEEATA
ncbi:Eco57I restriction-modification methylase domain-containing protein [Cyclobacterium xiamenense]|uniref:Eco57I restriction-modification methylase domain-containing protein n=1 Tax=Cyclobacterium xiamenense TaxID=1297121 RepID=UPI0012B80328|nr:N-6 DNA methylase [Cyclobacterium xiamenense]